MTGVRTPPSRRTTFDNSTTALKLLRDKFGPNIRIQRVEKHGVSGARVVQRENGQDFILAACFSGDPALRGVQAAAWALYPHLYH